ncbi:PP2C family protein-serine/threonine phosphatase [Nocardioides marmorisolisilvae]|uniref:Serine/threonine-protein phosphatase n=1 Tax=Nocardioides marmorisolisilvae TaxID=1542737 RepID=A0A3N0DIX6_9ACTN|nr:protein phosphatase 2C domain-containing protein [Nocardioides marmorisolisilvae]RNL75341.1 serine/threonine-protein phosphatase [Nocardioides marmorisolisilvae]
MTLALRFAALSDVGRVRKDNQDSGYVGPHLILVADGVGGAARGDIASSATVDAMRTLDVPPGNDALSQLSATLHLAHDRLAEIVEQHRELDGTSTTVSAAVFDGTHLQVAHVGDSRAYLLRDGVLTQITSDHTLVQSLVDEGRITEEEARVHPHRNLILRAVDGVHEPEPDLFPVEVRAGDRVLFCSDGCSGSLSTEQMAALMAGEPLEDVCARLVRSALDAGSSDNVTVLVAEVTEGEGDVAPQLVGAAALAPHRSIVNDHTGNLSESDLAGLAAHEIDPEELRYAPQAPPRGRWGRRLIVLLVLLALIGGAGYGAYRYSQTRYFVSDDHGNVAIFKGVNFDVPVVDLNHLVERTDIKLSDIQAFADDVRSGKDFSSLEKARVYAAGLNPVCAEPSTPSTQTLKSKVQGKLQLLGLHQVTVETFSTAGMPAPPHPLTYWTGDPAVLDCPGAS